MNTSSDPYSHNDVPQKTPRRADRFLPIMCGGVLFCLGFAAGFCYKQEFNTSNKSLPSIKSTGKKSAGKAKKAKEKARSILEDKYNITDLTKRSGEDGYTVLHYAAVENNVEKASLLIKGGAEIDAMDNEGVTPLARAIAINSFDVAQVLLDAGANINAGRYECSALYLAIDKRNVEGVKYALDHGSDIRKKSPDGWTYLMKAVDWAQLPDAAQLLIDAGIDVRAKNQQGQSALEVAEARSYSDTQRRCVEIIEQALNRDSTEDDD